MSGPQPASATGELTLQAVNTNLQVAYWESGDRHGAGAETSMLLQMDLYKQGSWVPQLTWEKRAFHCELHDRVTASFSQVSFASDIYE